MTTSTENDVGHLPPCGYLKWITRGAAALVIFITPFIWSAVSGSLERTNSKADTALEKTVKVERDIAVIQNDMKHQSRMIEDIHKKIVK